MHRYLLSPTVVFLLVFFYLFKVSKITTKFYDLFKVSKITTKFYDLFKFKKNTKAYLGMPIMQRNPLRKFIGEILRGNSIQSSHGCKKHYKKSIPRSSHGEFCC